MWSFFPFNRRKSQKAEKIKSRRELVTILKEYIGQTVTIQSTQFIHIYDNQIRQNNRIVTGKILEVDEAWINIEYDSRQFFKRDPLDHLIFRIDYIEGFSVNQTSSSSE